MYIILFKTITIKYMLLTYFIVIVIFIILCIMFHSYYTLLIKKRYIIPTLIDRFINYQINIQHIPGICIMINEHQHPSFFHSYGFANIETKEKMSLHHLFEIGSLGKQFIAFSILLLHQENRLSLYDSIDRYFPILSSLNLGTITIYQLVTHTSGLELLPKHFRKTYEYSYDEFLQLVCKSHLGFYPGCGWRYSHTGYILLVLIIEMICQESYFDFMKSRIFQPLKMNSVISNETLPKITHGYRQKTIRRSRSQPIGNMLLSAYIENEEPVSKFMNFATGGIAMSIIDFAKWDSFLYHPYLLGERLSQMMFESSYLNDGTTHFYGMGFRIDPLSKYNIIYHDGVWKGFTCSILHYQEEQLSIIIFCNCLNAPTTEIAQVIKHIYQKGLVYVE